MVKFVRPKPVVPAQREEHKRLLLVQHVLDPLEAGWQAALAAGDVDRAWRRCSMQRNGCREGRGTPRYVLTST